MSFLEAVFLGAVQGVAEFLPISSSGHLAIFQNLFHIGAGQNDMLFDVLLHFATLVSILIAYWSDVRDMVLELLIMLRLRKLPEGGQKNALSRRMIWFLIVGSVPLLFAVVFKDRVEALYDNMFFVGSALIATGCVLFFSDRFGGGNKTVREATILDALVVGAGQMFGVVPGLSRSGMTISAGIARGFDRTFAVKFSFLLSIPAVLGANLIQLISAMGDGVDWSLLPTYLAGMAVAAILGYLSIRLLKRIARKNSFGGFAYYCWGAGLLTFLLALVS